MGLDGAHHSVISVNFQSSTQPQPCLLRDAAAALKSLFRLRTETDRSIGTIDR